MKSSVVLKAVNFEPPTQVKGMEIEVRSMKGGERRQCQSRANQCRADLKSLRKSVEQVL